MNRRRRSPILAGLALAGVGLGVGATGTASAAEAHAFACNRDSTLTLAALDTASGTALFAAPPARPDEPGWWIEVEIGSEAGGDTAGAVRARYRAAAADRPFAGSIGPGPPFAVRRCGDECLQPVAWKDGGWRPLGEPVPGDGGTVHATYDRSGTPWLVLHRTAGDGGAVEARAFRLGEDGGWQDRGTLRALATGTVGALPDPSDADAVLSGTARFRAGGAPAPWVKGLPALPPERRGELLPGAEAGGGGTAAVYLDAGSRFYLSDDGGASWRRSEWTPWGISRARLWQPGRDYSVDLPIGDRRPPLSVAWFDRRDPAAERLHLTSWRPAGGWTVTAELPPRTTTLDGAVLAWDHLLRPGADRWLLISGCVYTTAGPGLAVRTAGPAGLSPPRFVSLTRAGR